MQEIKGHRRPKALYPRRLVQILVLAVLIIVPILTMNPSEWSPSRIVLGHLPPPSVMDISGDTWAFTIKGFRLIHPIAFLEGVLSSRILYIPLLVGAVIPLAITLVLGRVFCSWLCPVGLILELNQRLNGLLKKAGLNRPVWIPDLRYTLFFVMLLLSFFLSSPIISAIDPPHVFGRELMYLFTHRMLSLSGMGILLGILLFESFSTTRVWCSRLCPSGGGLSLLGARRLLRIDMDLTLCNHCGYCNTACPYNLEPMGLAEEEKRFDWIKCDNCGLCRDSCPTGAIKYVLKGR
jgi:ferredoxin-type protein NapH